MGPGRTTRTRLLVGLAFALGALAGAPAVAGEKLPSGPPWHRDFVKAHAEAVRTGKPLFVYFTKTY